MSNKSNKDGNDLERISLATLVKNRRFSEKLKEYHLDIHNQLQIKRDLKREKIIDSLGQNVGISINLNNWVRCIDMKYALSPVSPKGSNKLIGGRFNIGKDVHPDLADNYALYIAETEDTAFKEKFPESVSKTKLSDAELNLITKDKSYGFNKLEGVVNNIFDLTEPAFTEEFISIIKKFKINEFTNIKADKLKIPRWHSVKCYEDLHFMCMDINWRTHPMLLDIPSTSQIFGNLVRQSGFSGIKYKSTKGDAHCLALFPENFDDISKVIARDCPKETTLKSLNNMNWKDHIK